MLGRVLVVLLIAAAHLAAATAQPVQSQASLEEKVWDVRAHRFIPPVALMDALSKADFVLLGETHDNLEHHLHQAATIKAMISFGRRPAIVFEQFDREYQSAIDSAVARQGDTSSVADAGHFDRKGWGWENYAPLIDVALAGRLPLVAGNLSRADARAVAADGFAGLAAAEERLALAAVWSEPRDVALIDSLVAGHCGQLPREAAAGIALAQRARDATIADSMLPHRASGAVLIAGAGHARRDLAVPLYLRARARGASIVAVAFTEVHGGASGADPAAYEDKPAAGGSDGPIYDYLWFTPAAHRADPCAHLAPFVARPSVKSSATTPPHGDASNVTGRP